MSNLKDLRYWRMKMLDWSVTEALILAREAVCTWLMVKWVTMAMKSLIKYAIDYKEAAKR